MKKGIIQARGLGDIIIALPIARHYYEQGDEIHWPICENFMSSVKDHVDWVNWHSVEADPQGKFFFDEPIRILKEQGVEDDDMLYLYQYLSSVPELTEPELFNILKFDQYKYWVSEVPFFKKWSLSNCIKRDHTREQALIKTLELPEKYGVIHLKGSTATASVDMNVFKNLAMQAWVNVDEHKVESIFDWLGVLEGASAFIGIDSSFANLVDSMQMSIPEKFWIRRSSWDLTPVLGCAWSIVPNLNGLKDPQRVDPKAQAEEKARRLAGGVTSNIPFEVNKQGYPTNFMHAVKQDGVSGNIIR